MLRILITMKCKLVLTLLIAKFEICTILSRNSNMLCNKSAVILNFIPKFRIWNFGNKTPLVQRLAPLP
uniref:Uncharacterized protein n=1 Tax=Pararge aegeria TaxID=116150 RepID=S4PRM8_9NEOP